MMKILNAFAWVVMVGAIAGLALVAPAFAFAQTSPQGGWTGHSGARTGMPPGIFGAVSAINGNILTVTEKTMRPIPEQTSANATPTVYTVDASNAQIYKGSATTTIPVSSIAVGDTVMVQGTVIGTNVAATVIRDGVGGMNGKWPGTRGGKGFGKNGVSSTPSRPTSTPAIQGNGEPVIGGNVTAVSGTILTVTNVSNVTYTIDAASTTVIENGTSTTLSSVAVGDNVLVQGTVNGTSVTASSIIDQGTKSGTTTSTNASSSGRFHGGMGFSLGGFGGFFGAIGGFFQHLFGF